MNPFRPFVFGLLLGGAAIVAAIVAAQLEDDDDESLTSQRLFPDGEPVVAVTLTFVHPASSGAWMPLDANQPADRQIILRLVAWLNAAEEVERPASADDGPSQLLTFYTGRGAYAEVSIPRGCPKVGERIDCNSPAIEVDVLRWPDAHRFRTPEFAAWLAGGWENDFRHGTQEDFVREWERIGLPAVSE